MKRPIELALLCQLLLTGCGGEHATYAPDSSSESPSGTTIPPASEIIDAAGNRWTLAATPGSGNQVLQNANPAAYTAFVALVLYQGGVIYHENASQQWYRWSGSDWVATNDPRQSPTTPTTPPVTPPLGDLNLTGYHLSFDWEANDFATSSAPTPGKWTTTLSDGLRYLGNGDQECWTDGATGDSPFTLGGGVVSISARPTADAITLCNNSSLDQHGGPAYTAGVFTSQGMYSQLHGYFEIRAKLAEGIGMWPAFWLLTTHSNQQGGWPPELDVLEAFGAPLTTGSYGVQGGATQGHWAVHSQDKAGEAGDWATLSGNIFNAFHTYGALWELDYITYYYDGTQVAKVPTPSDFTLPMYVIANLAVGGYWPGFATGESASMQVDYIRIFSNDPAVPLAALQSLSSPDGGGDDFHGATTK